jgi:hypothetical protein
MPLFTRKLVEETIHPFELKWLGLIDSSFVIFFTMYDLELMTILHLRNVDELICFTNVVCTLYTIRCYSCIGEIIINKTHIC